MSFLLFFALFRAHQSIPNDPLIKNSYAIHNEGVYGSPYEEDLNIFPVWEDSHITGRGVTIAVIGAGCYDTNEELKGRRISQLNYNFDNNSTNIEPNIGDQHRERSTGLTGIIVGEANNGHCSAGVAFDSQFFYFKTTAEEKATIDILSKSNENATIKYYSISPSCQSYESSSSFSLCPLPVHSHEVEELIASIGTIVVIPAGNDAVSGGDSNLFSVSRAPNALTIADTTAGGMRPFWSNRGSSIIANAPAGGSTGILSSGSNNNNKTKYEPSPPSMGENQCLDLESGIPIGAGAAYASGVIALMKEANSELTARDIQAIFALTSTINDPYHKSWVLNGYGLNYSDIYGFGRINAQLAVDMAKKWIKMPNRHNYALLTFEPSKLDLLETRGGFASTVSVFSNDVGFIEYLELEFQCQDIAMINLYVTSPMGTTMKIVSPASLKTSDDTSEKYYYVIRGFFGENPKGTWNITVSREGFSDRLDIRNIKINIVGTPDAPSFPFATKKIGKDPSVPLPKKILLEASHTKFTCSSEVTVTIKEGETEFYDLYLRDEKHHANFQIAAGLEPGKPQSIKVPCIFKTGNYSLYAESRRLNASGHIPVVVENPHIDNTILNPTAYSTIIIDSTQKVAKIPLNISLHSEYLTTDSIGQSAIVGLYDYKNKVNIFRKPMLISELHTLTIPVEKNVEQGVLFVVPLWTTNTSGCGTMIQPVFLIGAHDDEPEKFEVPLTGVCPIPVGVNDGKYTKPNPTLRWIWIGGILGFAAAFVIAVTVWHFTCRKRGDDKRNDGYNDISKNEQLYQ